MTLLMVLRAGFVEGHWTALAVRQASCAVARMTPSKSSLERLPIGIGARGEANREGFESTLREAMVVPDEVGPTTCR